MKSRETQNFNCKMKKEIDYRRPDKLARKDLQRNAKITKDLF